MSQLQRGLLGGSGEKWVEKGLRRPRFESPRYLDPLTSEEDAAALRTFLETPPLEIEIGCGRGHFIEEMVRTHPDRRFLVIEARGRYVRMALRRLDRLGAENVRVVYGDARELLPSLVTPDAAQAVYLLFPDPWWKNKHIKKRVSTPAFLETIRSRLRPGGVLVFRSDVEAYVERMDGILSDVGGYERMDEIPEGTALSHRHKKCLTMGLPVWERGFRRDAEGGRE
ncbi:MAG: tRNA (guanosine(46)-N7)-methyltransferase TrmB [Pseudomonadota bacterium]